MGFSDNFFMADAIARVNGLSGAERDSILFSTEHENEMPDSPQGEAADSVTEENDPVVLERKIAALKRSVAFIKPNCKRANRAAHWRKLSICETGMLNLQEEFLKEITRLENRLNELLSQRTE